VCENDVRKLVMLAVVVGCSCMLGRALGADTLKPPCQADKILVVPMGEKGVTIGEFVTNLKGEPGKEETTATVKWDDKGFAVIFDCEDKQIVADRTQRDDLELWKDDNVEFFLDVGHTHDIESVWVHVIITPKGTIYDEEGPVAARFTSGEIASGMLGFDPENMKAKAETTARGWRAEIMIPWADMELEPPKVGDVWGLNLNRTDHPEEEFLCFSQTYGFFYSIHQWGHLVFADKDGETGMTAEELNQKVAARHKEKGLELTKEEAEKLKAAQEAAEKKKKEKEAAEDVE